MKRILIIISFLYSIFAVNAQAQKATIEYSNVPFDVSTKTVPKGYVGQDIVALYYALASIKPTKGEFETSTQFEKRKAKLFSGAITGQLTFQSTYAIKIDLHRSNSYNYLTYDADKQQLLVSYLLGNIPTEIGGSDITHSQRLMPTGRYTEKISGTYIGENEYGAKRTVRKLTSKEYSLIFNNTGKYSFETDELTPYLGININFHVPMPIDVARDVKPSLNLLVVYKMASPYTATYMQHIPPTTDNPIDGFHYNYLVYVDVTEIWLYDSRTGKVYYKISPNN